VTVVGPAVIADAPKLLGLRDVAARSLRDRRIEPWLPEEVSIADIEHQILDGEWHVTRNAGDIIGGLRRRWEDPGAGRSAAGRGICARTRDRA
jgi:hypothetical protein